MNILFIVPYVPTLIRSRPYNLIRALTSLGHCVTVATLWSNDEERIVAEKLEKECFRVLAFHQSKIRSLLNSLSALPTRIPLQSVYSWHPELAKEIGKLSQGTNDTEKFDIVHVEHLRGVRYGLHLISIQNSQPFDQPSTLPIVWDSVDCISFLFRQTAMYSKRRRARLVSRFELDRTEQYERYLVNQFDRILVTTSTDKEALITLNGDSHKSEAISVLPNGVDLSYFSPGKERFREKDTIIISGKMSYHANISMTIHFIENILPLIWAQRPSVKLWVVGKDPPHEVQMLSENPRITVTGTVHDIRPYLQRATIAVVPLTYGAGIQNKVLESMACATPVVTTTKAISPLSAISGVDVLAVDEPRDFAQTVLRLLENPKHRNQVGCAGRKFVEKNHRWDTIAMRLELLYQEVINIKSQHQQTQSYDSVRTG